MERLLAIVWMFFGAGFYSYSVGSLSNVIIGLDSRKSSSRKKRLIMDEFCKDNNFTKDFHKKINKAIDYASFKSLFTNDEKTEIFRELPSSMKYEVKF